MTVHATSALSEIVPRYTSYPTAPHFHTGIGESDAKRWISQLQSGNAVSLYVHIPFCDKLCWFCACHTKHTLHYKPVADFLVALHEEIRLVSSQLPSGVHVKAIHFGGGSPTMLRPHDLIHLVGMIRSSLHVDRTVALSVEIDPNDMDDHRLDALAVIGLTRASLGVQDFDPKVQNAINRMQSFELTKKVVEGLRARGAVSVNLDLLYGLPHQTVASVAETVRLALSLRPDRIALFGYAHVPWFKKHQTMIDEASLPDGEQRFAQSRKAASIIAKGGYDAIGIDHFALPDDSLSEAARRHRLHRNFQGYTDDGCETLIGMGPSSISRYRQGYAQNIIAAGEYEKAVHAGRLPVSRGIEFSRDDVATAWLIERLMCDFEFSVEELVQQFGDCGQSLLAEAARLARGEPDKLLLENDRFIVPAGQRPLVRTIAARFDRYLHRGTARHSAAV
ncbi:MAG: oxygen-independent coproporphyrinogen III oxidase [Mesorhizobium sp.]|uniref:oxygen-independent coproporphyrinogen III oxidase n=1 Tax=unclassified Mesorhizobium TaxID=325217 RepID=UPI000FCB13C7|nr:MULTISPECIES: oxygen-independent coproporphyrinogen III oxidase [unclassified Mesorhizobium]RUV73245.1 oxygen-independent coproporphyrinogen III oxidase [Mesorhizobium sp. M5C.F.Cr.IN.023.01.1.1]RWF86669.1 MAG: oxygen-independent coproporphyrinogen III oxidase [Mesorhizobium sp.]RWF95370.1 MAG: oxygen-independent coproporphyrinogen III oxidase [Mesorhizobium sp.]RWI39791.1 MAG: oxygen-independent coproporphyrinogen III oxidase [Mesorhizobium sp.]RWI45343.1 MAG: oxygen-independent coproporph